MAGVISHKCCFSSDPVWNKIIMDLCARTRNMICFTIRNKIFVGHMVRMCG